MMIQPSVPACRPGETGAASLHRLGDRFLLAAWETSAHEDGMKYLQPVLDEAPAPRPYTTLAVPTAWGSRRRFVLFPWPGATSRGIARFHDGSGRLLAEARTAAGLPDFDPTPLVGGLDAGGRLRLARMMLDFCRSSPASRGDSDFIAACRRLILHLAPQPAPLLACATLTDTLLLCEGMVPAGFGTLLGAVLLAPDTIAAPPFPPEIAPPEIAADGDGRGRLPLRAALDRTLCGPDTLLVLLGSSGLACRTLVNGQGAVPPLLEWLERHPRALAARDYAARCLAARSHGEPAAAATVHELQVLMPVPQRRLADPARPVGAAVNLAIPTGNGGLFLAGWLHDPHGLVRELVVETPFGGERRLGQWPVRFASDEASALFPVPSAAGSAQGFAAFLPGPAEPAPVHQVRCALLLGSGGRIELVPPPRPISDADARNAILGALPPGAVTAAVLEEVLAPAIAPLHAAHLKASRRPPTVHRFGPPPARPAASLVIPLYRALDFMRFQMSAFATDPAMAGVEIIFVLDSPEQEAELVHLLRGLHTLYGLPVTLLVHAANFGFSAACNSGAAASRGRHIVFLNSDVIPDRPGWLPPLLAALAVRGTGITGPKLLFDDDSLQHAGMHFTRDPAGRWYNAHYFKGMPRDFAPACRPRPVPAVTGACLAIPAALFEQVGGFTEDYVIGDYEDSDLCLKVRALGRQIRYVPEVELYHLERQSIARHGGYCRGVADLYNGWLHTRRWAGAMAELMARDWPAAPAAAAAVGLSFRRRAA